MGAIGKYFNLLALQQPGQQMARHAANAGHQLEAGTARLDDVERLGKNLPTDPLFGTHRGRLEALRNFRNTHEDFDEAVDAALGFSRERPGSTSITTVISEADDAADGANRLLRNYPGVPREIIDDVDDAEKYADRAVDRLDDARRYPLPEQRREAARAADDLDDGERAMRHAVDGMDRLLAVFRPHDRARAAAEDALTEAARRGRKAGNVDRVSADLADQARTVETKTADAARAMTGLPQGGATGEVKALTTAAQDATEALRQAARSEPNPKGWKRDVALAWGGTLGVPVGGTAAYLAAKDKLPF